MITFLGSGLTSETADTILELLRSGFKRDWSMRSTVSGYFCKGDGRKLVYANPQPSLSPDDKRCDHMLTALPSWIRNADAVAACILASQTSVVEVASSLPGDSARNTSQPLERLLKRMHSILQ